MIAKKKMAKAKNGKSFPDLNKDGKITKADILKGRGVIAKKGTNIKKAQNGIITKRLGKKGEDTLEMTSNYAKALENSRNKSKIRKEKAQTDVKKKPGMMKSGGTMKKCRYGCK